MKRGRSILFVVNEILVVSSNVCDCKLTILLDRDRTIIPLRVLARILFAARRTGSGQMI